MRRHRYAPSTVEEWRPCIPHARFLLHTDLTNISVPGKRHCFTFWSVLVWRSPKVFLKLAFAAKKLVKLENSLTLCWWRTSPNTLMFSGKPCMSLAEKSTFHKHLVFHWKSSSIEFRSRYYFYENREILTSSHQFCTALLFYAPLRLTFLRKVQVYF